jgi:hypothetical protein
LSFLLITVLAIMVIYDKKTSKIENKTQPSLCLQTWLQQNLQISTNHRIYMDVFLQPDVLKTTVYGIAGLDNTRSPTCLRYCRTNERTPILQERRAAACAKFWRISTEDGDPGSEEISYSTESSKYLIKKIYNGKNESLSNRLCMISK